MNWINWTSKRWFSMFFLFYLCIVWFFYFLMLFIQLFFLLGLLKFKKKVDKTKCTNVYRKIPYTRSGFAELSFCIFHYKKLPISSNQSNPSHTDLPAVYIYKWLKLISCPFFLCHFYTYCKKNDREQSKVDLTDFSFVWTFRISLMHLATLPHSLDPFHRRNE